MDEQQGLIPSHLRQVDRFENDLKSFLSLSIDQLEALARIGENPKGYRRSMRAEEFSVEAGLSRETASNALDFALFLYERCREYNIGPNIAAGELIEIGKELQIEGIEEKRSVLGSVVAVKTDFERSGYADRILASVVPHYEDIEGVWDLRVVFNRESGNVSTTLPTLIMSVSWHDMVGQRHQAVFQLNEEEWAELRRSVDKLHDQLLALKTHIQGT